MENQNTKTQNLVVFSLLIAIEAILTISNLGFIMIGPVSITTLHIPVIIAGIVLGPNGGMIVGSSFGIFSMLNATFRGTSPFNLAFSPFYSGHPVQSLIMCIGCRILLGFTAGIIFKLVSKVDKTNIASSVAAAFIGTLVHTTSVMLCLWLLFPDLSFTFKAVIETIVAVNFLAEAVAAVVFATAFAKVLPYIMRKTTRA